MRGPHGEDLPDAVLFACTMNAIRSPMAAALMRHLFGKFVFVDSVGVKVGETDPLAAEAMAEIGLDLDGHAPKSFEELQDTSFDLIISLSPEAQHKAVDMTRTMAAEVEYWPTLDPSMVEGSREQRLDAYRLVRDQLLARLKARFAHPFEG
ncbi:MAG: arsenate reductase ArsC [Alphaproteobacteria bacterium]|nr:arsenate reductase ArsC [Alphaproteobacteria bacterium]